MPVDNTIMCVSFWVLPTGGGIAGRQARGRSVIENTFFGHVRLGKPTFA